MTNRPGNRLVYLNSRPRPDDHDLQAHPRGPSRVAVAISAQTGSGALWIAERLAAHLQETEPDTERPWKVFHRSLIVKILEDHHLPIRMAKFLPEDAKNVVDDVLDELFGFHPSSWVMVQNSIETICRLVAEGNVIFVGWAVNAITRDLSDVFHVRLVGSIDRRVARIQVRENLSRKEALAFIERSDRGRERYSKRYFERSVSDVLLYDLTINTDQFSDIEVLQLISGAIWTRRARGSAVSRSARVNPHPGI